MAAYSAVASLMNNIEQMMIDPRLSTSLDKYQVQSLLKTAAFLLDFMEGYNYGGVISKEVEDLERQIARAAHAAEDVIESHVVDQIHAGTSRASLRCLFGLEQIIEDMDGVSEKVNELKEKQGFTEEQPTNSTRPLMETTMVGCEEELIQIMDELTNQQSSRNVISIVGMGGMGKTTLAQNVYQSLLIKQHFVVRAWATVSQQFNVQDILSQLLSDLGTVGQSGEQLYRTLIGRRYLIILDDIWSVEAWDEVARFFPDDRIRSRVVLTTRLSNLARDCLSSSLFAMKPLDEDKSWVLFCKKAFQQETCPYAKLERVGREIAGLCRGLPLSTIVIGGLLRKSPRSLRFWEDVVRNLKSNPGSKEKEESLDILSLSYNHLPSHLKPCFLYMGVFEEDSYVRASRIIKLWVGEGFIRPNNTTPMLEEIGEVYLKELVDRNLISVGTIHKNGKIASCCIHDLLRDLCLKVGKQQEFFHVSKGHIRGSPERRIVCHKWHTIPYSGPSLGRSILAWNAFEKDAADRKLLRVWETECSVRSPEKLFSNVNLRYLAFVSWFQDQPEWELPSSISLLWNLKTLIIRESDLTTVVAPVEIWKMRQLRHIKCSKIYLPSDGLFAVDTLRTLTTAVNLRLSEEVCKMIPNIMKLHLLYQRNLRGYDDGLIEFLRNLGHLHNLESLKLSVKGNKKLITESNLIKKLAFPASIKQLSLSGCQLGWADLQMIASLPELEVLELGISSVMVGNKWSLVDEQFLRLRFLKIDWCNLDYWKADSFNFPVLTKLILSGLRQLVEIPWGIGDIPTLELIRVEYCTESAAISAVRIKEEQVQMGNGGLEIQVRIFDKDLESFKENVETDGLTINDIDLEIR